MKEPSQRCPILQAGIDTIANFYWMEKEKIITMVKKGGEKVAKLTGPTSIARYTIKLSKQ